MYFLKEKSEAFEAFKKFKVFVKNYENSYLIKALITDRGGEFASKQFDIFRRSHRIRRFLLVPRSLQQNGVIDKNMPILNITKSMIKNKHIPKEF